ncbi:uncharacterized protein LOC131668611 [Phymastichus coffea]|uniref:uncharacterized protein LOC131668611 n=1 Tax=Phymastichus coffea TaxID=108790 RepID=UPI00273CB3E1|nr:uncharacterized protein LOC131668611 [Phymastichus coffea]
MPRATTGARRVVASSCFTTVNLLLLATASLIALVHSALPPGQEDEIIVIEHLPGRRVHLQDFFWTGAEDAPPWLDPDQMLTIYETRTVHHTATLYVPEDTSRRPEPSDDRPRPTVDCASCIDPTPTLLDVDQNIGVLIDGEDPGPRYWLLTVLKAGEDVPPKVELRLARLYKAAFTRQQQKHLGLLGPELRTRKSPKREAIIDNRTALEEETTTSETALGNDSTTGPAIIQRPPSAISLLHMRTLRIAKSKRTLPVLESENFGELASKPVELNETTSEDKAQLKSPVDVGLVQVRMQNTSKTEAGAMRLIYTVHLGGKPVPAETAAKDMSLLSAQEVALELGAPVIIQSEPYLKESRPLALSRKRDAWLLVGAASLGILLVGVIVLGLFVATKRKRAQSAVSAPLPSRRTLVKDEEYAPTTPGFDNTAYTSETEARTEVTGRTPGSQDTMDVDYPRGELSSENELDNEHRGGPQVKTWEYAEAAKKGATSKRGQQQHQQQQPRSVEQTNDNRPQSGDSVDSAGMLTRTTTEGRVSNTRAANDEDDEASGSPHSYLSMPSCKQFPNMRSVEPLSKVLEPVVIKHMALELDSPEMNMKNLEFTVRNGDGHLTRAASETKDPGVLGPIVWDLKRKRAVEGGAAEQVGSGRVPHGPVGRARRRLNELLEDSFSLFGSRDPKSAAAAAATATSQRGFSFEKRAPPEMPPGQGTIHHPAPRTYSTTTATEHRGKSAHVEHVTSPNVDSQHYRQRTSLPDAAPIPETGQIVGPQPRGAWGSRPLSAGPFHRPNLPEVEVVRVLADSQLRPEDPAVPLISAIKKELGKFTYD